MRSTPALAIAVCALAGIFAASSSAEAVPRKPKKAAPPAAKPIGSGAEPYSPTKCQWLAVELNANFSERDLKNGYTLQVYCRAPNTIFLSYRYLSDSNTDAMDERDETIHEAVAQVVRARNWTWVKLDGEMLKAEAAPAPAIPTAAAGNSGSAPLNTKPVVVKPPARPDDETPSENTETTEPASSEEPGETSSSQKSTPPPAAPSGLAE